VHEHTAATPASQHDERRPARDGGILEMWLDLGQLLE
jgi:hypothetical protein